MKNNQKEKEIFPMGKGKRNRNKGEITPETPVVLPKKKKKMKRAMPKWLVRTISIAVAVVIVCGIAALAMLSNGTFRRMQILVKSKTGEFDIDRQTATFIAWEMQYYYATIEYLTASDDSDLKSTYSSADEYAFNFATKVVTEEIEDADGNVVSTPRDAIDDTISTMVNFVAVCDYAHEQKNMTVTDSEWQGNIGITWYYGYTDTLPVTWSDLQKNLQPDSNGWAYASLDLYLDAVFGHGMKQKDVEKGLKIISLYEKYMAQYKQEIDAGVDTADHDVIAEYVKNNPQYFYTVEYLKHTTEKVDLKTALENATDAKGFKSAIALDWFEDGNYKETYNSYVTLIKAEKEHKTLDETVNTAKDAYKAADSIQNEQERAAAKQAALKPLKDAAIALGALEKSYQESDKPNLDEALSKELFTAHSVGDREIVIVGEKIYSIVILDQTRDGGKIKGVNACIEEIEFASGDSYNENGVVDNAFKENMKQYLLAKKELTSDAKPEVLHKTAAAYAEELRATYASLDKDAIIAKMIEDGKVEGRKYGSKNQNSPLSSSTADAEYKDIIKRLFGSDDIINADISENNFYVAETDEATAYLVYVEALGTKDLTSTEADKTKFASIHYVKVEGDVFFKILVELAEELEKVLPAETDEYYTATPKEDTYQYWMFNGATVENGFASPESLNKPYVSEKEKTSSDGTGENTKEYTVYFAVEKIHLDKSRLVNGGYLAYVGNELDAKLATLEGKSGDDLIAALKAIGSAANTSKNLSEDGIDEELAAWLFSPERDAEGAKKYTSVKGEDGETYIAVYNSAIEAWRSTGRAYYVSDVSSKWLVSIAKDYTVNQRVLNRIGDPTPEATTTTEQ